MKRRLVYVLGLAMLINFSACSSDDDYQEEEGGDSEQGIVPRRMSKMTTYDENGKKEDVTRYEYSENKIKVYSSWRGEEERLDYKIEFKNDKIYYYNAKSDYIEPEPYTSYDEPTILHYKNGLIIEEVDKDGFQDAYSYEYEKGYLTTVLITNDILSKFHYTSGNLSTIKESHDYDKDESERIYSTIGEYTYYDYPDKLGLIAPMDESGYNDESFGIYFGSPLYQMGYFGARSKNLVKSYTHTNRGYDGKSDYTKLENFKYEFDDQGYVTQILKQEVEYGKEYISTYKIEYENKSIESILTK